MAVNQGRLEEVALLPEEQTEKIDVTNTSSGLLKKGPSMDYQFERLEDQSQQSGGAHSKTEKTTTITTGIAFSGGGIRSAAFCSGALRRMLGTDVSMNVYLSCVSGGGYTGAAFLDWKYKPGKPPRPDSTDGDNRESGEDVESGLHDRFFENMRKNAGYVCNWNKCVQGTAEAVIFFVILIVTVFILPCVLWLPYSLPVAVIVDFLFGDILREGNTCSQPTKSSLTRSSKLVMELYDDCAPSGSRVCLFVLTSLASLILYFVSRRKCSRRFRGPLRFLSIVCWLVFVFTFFPWFAHDVLYPMKAWIQVLAFVILLVVPFNFPIVRQYAAVYIAFYAYTYIICWKVFKRIELFGAVPYSDSVFYALLMFCAVIFLLFPVLGSIHQTCFNVYYRYRLSKAFFKRVARLHWEDCFPWCVQLRRALDLGRQRNPTYHGKAQAMLNNDGEPTMMNSDKELKLDRLANPRSQYPTFISNITVNNWQIVENKDDESHHLLAFSPEEVKLIGKYVTENGDMIPTDELFNGLFRPKDMRLSSAMAISGAALSFDMGHYENKLDMVLDLLALLGIGMGDEKVCNQKEEEGNGPYYKWIKPTLVEIVLCLPLVASPLGYYFGHSTNWVFALVFVHIVIVLLLSCVAVLHTGHERDYCCLRFFITRIFFVRFLRGFLNIPNVGTDPPLVLRLSDGGHFENLALLPLLEKKLEKIVIVDGSCNPGGDKYADELIRALEIARKKLPCWFEGKTVKNIEDDIRINFLTKDENKKLPRHYEFKVHYYNTDTGETSEGEIMFLAPRHPRESKKLNYPDPEQIICEQPRAGTSSEPSQNERELGEEWKRLYHHNLSKADWGDGPELTEDEANELNWCCCPCCHCKKSDCCHGCECECCSDGCCHCLSSWCLGEFPHHKTANQFFTPRMFAAYHREGYAACVEAELFTGKRKLLS